MVSLGLSRAKTARHFGAFMFTLGIASATPAVWACPIHITDAAEAAAAERIAFANTSFAAWTSAISETTVSADNATAALTVNQATDPAIFAWRQNVGGQTGTSPNATINNVVRQISADVKSVAFTSTDVYVRASGVPSHSVGPFPGNPAAPSDINRLFRIPRTPVAQTGTTTATSLGAIGVMVNGVPFYNAADGRSYNNANVWHQNAIIAEASSFDAALGHPNPNQGATGTPIPGTYHYHQTPIALLQQLDPGNTGQHHSPIIGYALDGFPIYGPYGFTNANGTGGVQKMDSSYQLRSITQRTTLPNGTTLQASQYGPTVATTALGYYLEDFAFVAGAGDLDVHNGRFAITPEYPQGTYAYFSTVDPTDQSSYPYLIGPRYYGVVSADNLGNGSVVLPTDVTYYVAATPEPTSAATLAISMAVLAFHRRRRHALHA